MFIQRSIFKGHVILRLCEVCLKSAAMLRHGNSGLYVPLACVKNFRCHPVSLFTLNIMTRSSRASTSEPTLSCNRRSDQQFLIGRSFSALSWLKRCEPAYCSLEHPINYSTSQPRARFPILMSPNKPLYYPLSAGQVFTLLFSGKKQFISNMTLSCTQSETCLSPTTKLRRQR